MRVTQCQFSRALTLIELLVIVMLLPSLRHARESAKANSYEGYFDVTKTRRFGAAVDVAGGPPAAIIVTDKYGPMAGWQNNSQFSLCINEMPINTTANWSQAFRHPGNRLNALYLDGHVGVLQHKSVTGQDIVIQAWTSGP